MPALSFPPVLAAPAAIVAASIGFASTLDGDDGPSLCGFRRCTGGYCPGCGASRAALALARGDLAGSWSVHPWVPLLAAQFAFAAILCIGVGTERLRPLLVPALVANLILGIGLWATRLVTGAIPVPFT